MLAGDTSDTLEQLHARRADAVAPSPKTHVATLETILAHCAQHPTVYLPSHDPESEAHLGRLDHGELRTAVDVAAGHRDTPQASSAIDVVLQSLTKSTVPSLATVVIKGDRVICEQAIGLADIAGGRAATLDTVYLWFSMTKIVTATAAKQLVERGRLSLDDAVARYVPEFPRPRNGWPEVKVRHLLGQQLWPGQPDPRPVGTCRRGARP